MAHGENRVEKRNSIEMLPPLRGQESYRNIYIYISPPLLVIAIIVYFSNIMLLRCRRRYQK